MCMRKTDLIQFQVLCLRGNLHDGGKEGLRVEEKGEIDDRQQRGGIAHPHLKLLDAIIQVGEPRTERAHGGIGQRGPGSCQEERKNAMNQ